MLRRGLDIIASGLGLLILSPFLLIVALVIVLDSKGPVFYRGPRVGLGGRPFRIYKFRTMVINADRQGPGITTAGDSRITAVGQRLRSTKLDELPQLVNVLVGDMSLVGPRPEDPRYVALYSDEQRQILNVRPGITSRASLEFRDEAALLQGADWEERYIREIMPHKLALDMPFAMNPTLGAYLKILLGTLFALVFRSGPDRDQKMGVE